MYPKKFLEQNNESIEKGLCFVIMPVTPELNYVYHNGIKPVVKTLGMKCVRFDEIYTALPMIDILSVLQKAEIVIADLTGKNPNVLYELGIAHAIKDKVIIISQSLEDIPFDLRHIRCVLYKNNSSAGIETFQLKLKKEIELLSMPQLLLIATSFQGELDFNFDVNHYRYLLSKAENDLDLQALVTYLLNSTGFEVQARGSNESQSLSSMDMVVWNNTKFLSLQILGNPIVVKCKLEDVDMGIVGKALMYLISTKLTAGFIFSAGKFTTNAIAEISKASVKTIRILPFDMMELRAISSGKDFIAIVEEKIREIVLRERAT